jgi:hypothetical protein
MPSKLSNQIIDERIKNRSLERVDDFINTTTKIKWKCLIDNTIWSATPSNIIYGYGCPVCGGCIKLTNEIIDERLEGRLIKRIGEYKNIDTKILFKCLIDDYIWEAIPNSILNTGHGCPKCSNHLRLSNEIIDERISCRPIKRIGEFTSVNKKIEWICLYHNTSWMETSANILYHQGACPLCNKTKIFTNEIIDEILKKKNIKRMEEYKNSKTKIKFNCTICNYFWKTTPQVLCSKHGCPNCSNRARLTNEIIDERISDRPIKRIGDCSGALSKIKFKCLNNNCNSFWHTTPSSILNSGYGCPICASSKGEKLIKNLLDKYVDFIIHKQHFSIEFNNRKYYPDFYLENNGKIVFIEYNGIQHYKPIQFNGISKEKSEEKFLIQKQRDLELQKYCEVNKIKLIEIPYNMKLNEIENIIKTLDKYFI